MDYPTLISFADEILSRKDPYNHHGIKVAELSLKIARQMNDPINLQTLEYAARLHDVGKIMLDDALLNFPRKLTDTERMKMREHVTIGAAMLRNSGCDLDVYNAVLCHHEKWDGSGYPRGLGGEDIPLLARVIAVADVWNAISSERAYRKAMSFEETLAEMNRTCHWFDPKVYACFLKVIRELV